MLSIVSVLYRIMPFRIPPVEEGRSLHFPYDLSSSEEELDDEVGDEIAYKKKARLFDRQARAADRLSIRLLEVDKEEDEDRVLRETLRLSQQQYSPSSTRASIEAARKAKRRVWVMLSMAVVVILVLILLVVLGIRYVGPPLQPVGPYHLIERQEGMDFFQYYNFYEGRDSVGSNGYLMYVSEERALELGILNVTMEQDTENVYDASNSSNATAEPFVYMASAPTADGPRESIRLEGKRRFHRGLFIIDLRHMPAGCGVWPAFWLTDEANWPVNGEIDIVEGTKMRMRASFQSLRMTMSAVQQCLFRLFEPFVALNCFDRVLTSHYWLRINRSELSEYSKNGIAFYKRMFHGRCAGGCTLRRVGYRRWHSRSKDGHPRHDYAVCYQLFCV